MKGTLILIIILAVLGGGYYWYSQNQAPAMDNSMVPDQNAMDTGSTGDAAMSDTGATNNTGAVKEFTVIGQPFSFTPATMTVKKGDTVKLIFKNMQGTHDWRLDEFNAKTNVIQGGQEETITFVADKGGTFEYYCSVGTHRRMGMKGTFTVTE